MQPGVGKVDMVGGRFSFLEETATDLRLNMRLWLQSQFGLGMKCELPLAFFSFSLRDIVFLKMSTLFVYAVLPNYQTANYPGTGTRKILKKKIFLDI